MPLSPSRFTQCSPSPYPYEQEAVEFIRAALPDTDPYRAWALCDLVDSTGSRYEIDLLVIGRHALYLIEVKSYPGEISGDTNDWLIRAPEGHLKHRESPFRLAHHKAKVLASLLERSRLGRERPRVEALIFLSHPDVKIHKLDPRARAHVVLRSDLARAITHAEFPGAEPWLRDHQINAPAARGIAEALRALGIQKGRRDRRLGELVLDSLLEEGPGYQDHLAHHERIHERLTRVRHYLVPQATTRERREQLARAAEREARLLTILRDHPGILYLREPLLDTPLGGPCLLFDHNKDFTPLDAFLRRHPDLPFAERVTILQRVAEALGYCHRKQIYHRGLHPGSVLVRRPEEKDQGLEVRLYNFQLAAHSDGSHGTLHLAAFSADPTLLYRAPEVLADPAQACAESDLFSLGALAYFLLTGRPPGADLAERQALLRAGDHALSIAAASDALASQRDLDLVVRMATAENPLDRGTVTSWLALLLEVATAPEPSREPAPLDARADEVLGDLRVRAPLGTGSTARVLRVERGGQSLALKIALTPKDEDRLRAEADILQRLKCDRIVTLHQELRLGEDAGRRLCLLLTDAGQTLADLLAEEGPVNLDYASRWGNDLIWALMDLEDKDIQHRDIKPQNVGVLSGDQKRARHLLLFDFSLSTIAPTQIDAGTVAYRDPFLHERGRWDAAADRYSAAATLYEMLTGQRLQRSAELTSDSAQRSAAPFINAERFDPSARDRLHAFFRKAFDRDVSKRHPSAAAMQADWLACFAPAPALTTATQAPPASTADGPASAPDDARDQATIDLELNPILARARPETPVAALPLSARAKNALDRAGVLRVHELLALPRNQLSMIRGVGRGTVKEILHLLLRYHELHQTPQAEGPLAPLHPSYEGPDPALDAVPGLPADAAAALADAGLTRLAQVAATPSERLTRILAGQPKALPLLRAALKAPAADPTSAAAPGESPDPGEPQAPQSIEEWLRELCPTPRRARGDKPLQHVRQLLGLDPVAGQHVEDAQALAQALGVSRQLIYASLKEARARWALHPALPVLLAEVAAALHSLHGVAPLDQVADALLLRLPSTAARAGDATEAARRARALCRLTALLAEHLTPDGAPLPAPHLARHQQRPWLSSHREPLALLPRLSARADALAQRDPLPSADEVRDALTQEVRDSRLQHLPIERLISLAAEASQGAAASARLELYPRGLSATRALTLSAGALSGDALTVAEVTYIVHARYPEAQALPPRPALDALLAPLRYDEGRGAYLRPAAEPSATYQQPLPRLTTTSSAPRLRSDPEEQEALEFQQRLRLIAQRGAYRVLRVNLKRAEEAAWQLHRALGGTLVSVARELLQAAHEVQKELGIDPAVVYAADRAGPGHEDWTNLRDLFQESAARALPRILSQPGPLLLTHAGLLGRYQQQEFLRQLLVATEASDAPAVLLLLPAFDEGGPAVLRGPAGPLPIPLNTVAAPLQVPESWLRNLHQGRHSDSAA